MPNLWECALHWRRAKFQSETTLPLAELLVGTLIELVAARSAGLDSNWLRTMTDWCAEEIGRTPGEILFRSNPIRLMCVIRLIARKGIALPPNGAEYLQFLRDVTNDGTVARWQTPALELLLCTRPAQARTTEFTYSTGENYLGNFGRALGEIEHETECGARRATIGPVQRALLYAGASRAVALDDFTSGARALRCFHYVVADDRDRQREEVLLDAICARQEPEGHFGPQDDKGLAEQLLRVFECLWAIAEVSSNFRLFQDLAPAGADI
jgi:hypothetical protein